MAEVPSDPVLAPLPQTPVLGYLTGASFTPTRVRRIASRCLWVAAIVQAIMSIILTVPLAHEFSEEFTGLTSRAVFLPGVGRWVWRTTTPTFQTALSATKAVVADDPTAVALLVILLAGVVLFPLLAGRVAKGRRLASYSACVYLAAMDCLLAAAFLFLGCGLFVSSFNANPRVHDWWAVLWLIILPIGGMVCVLVKDVCGFLFWIARHPATEKPPVPFLPTTKEARP